MNETLGVVKTESNISVPIWSVSNFLDNTISNYLKLITLRELNQKFIEGASDQDFYISINSYDLFPMIDDFHYAENQLIILTSKVKSAKDFWHYFKYLHRPVVLFKDTNSYNPLYEFDTRNALKIRSLSLNSPFTFSLQGALGVFADLFAGKLFVQRANERTAQSIQNLEGIIRTSHLIEDGRTPPGVRAFAVDQIENIMNKQARINEKLGINVVKILE